jgi:hypothetical protein
MTYNNQDRAALAFQYTQFNASANLINLVADGVVYFAGTFGPTTVQGAQAFNFGTLGYTGTRYVTMEIIPMPGQSQLSRGYILDEFDNPLPYLPSIYYRVMGGTTVLYVQQPFGAANTQTYRFGMSVPNTASAGEGQIILRFDDMGQEIQRINYYWNNI